MTQPTRSPLQPLRITNGESLIFAAPEIDRSRRPVVSMSKTAEGHTYVHFRVYKRNGEEAVSGYHMTDAGCSISPDEFREAFARFEELMRESSV